MTRGPVSAISLSTRSTGLDRVTSIAEIHERVERLSKLVPDLDPDRLWGWCQATAAALAILQLGRRPPDATTHILLEIAASTGAL